MTDYEKTVDMINKVVIAQGEIQRIMIWLSRLHKDLQEFEKELIIERNNEPARFHP
jgi:hypothetical protein